MNFYKADMHCSKKYTSIHCRLVARRSACINVTLDLIRCSLILKVLFSINVWRVTMTRIFSVLKMKAYNRYKNSSSSLFRMSEHLIKSMYLVDTGIIKGHLD